MTPRAASLFGCAAVLAVSMVMAGCGVTVKTAGFDKLQTGSPLKGVPRKTFVLREFQDVRGTEPSLVGKWRGNEFRLDKPAAAVVGTAIQGELERNDHVAIINSPDLNAQYVIEGAVYRYWLTPAESLIRITVTANVAVKLTITAASDAKRVLKKSYEGEYHFSSGVGVFIWEWHLIANRALLDMVKNVSTDLELVTFISQ